MMATDDGSQTMSEDQINASPPSEEEHKKKSKKEEVDERNPDAEDPRLYSPLQEPDRPACSERTSDEEKSSSDSPESA